MLLDAVAAIPLFIWIYLILARGKFWRVSEHFAPPLDSVEGKRVAVVIPARDEAAVIGRTISSILNQEFTSPIPMFVVDDDSIDGTGEAAQLAAENFGCPERVTVIQGKPLPGGWSGKLWALSQGVLEAEKFTPDYLLFTDADIAHEPRSIAQLVSIAERYHCDLTSFMVKLECATAAEKALIPAFVFFFLKLYPPAWIRSQTSKTAGAAGGCILIRPHALKRIGGLNAIRGEVIDDCALARAVKKNGGRIWMGLNDKAQSTRSYRTFGEIGKMISRTAFNQLHHSAALLLGTIAGLIFTYVLPPLLLLSGRSISAILGAAAWILMCLAYLPTLKLYGRSPLWALTLPLVASFYMGATIHSAVQYWTGHGGMWKGRVQDVRSER